MVLLPVADSFDYLEPVVDEAREIPFESLNTLSVRLLSSLLQSLPLMNLVRYRTRCSFMGAITT